MIDDVLPEASLADVCLEVCPMLLLFLNITSWSLSY